MTTYQKKRKIKKRNFTLLIGIIVVVALVVGAIFLIQKIGGNDSKKPANPSTQKENIKLGKVGYSDDFNGTVPEEMKKVILSYMELYYQSVQTLEEKDMTSLFSPNAYEQAEINQAAISLLVSIRKMQVNDLSIFKGHYDITFAEKKEKDGKTTITFYEDNVLNFTFMKETESKSYGIENEITLEKVNGEYKIVDYNKVEDFFVMIDDEYETNSDSSKDIVKSKLSSLKERLLKDAKENLEKDQSWLDEIKEGKEAPTLTCDHPYDREKALAYAKKWVVNRNPEWGNYSGYGGNCQNYASQVVYTGGVPMDTYGNQAIQWKWYGEEVDNTETKNGRTPSWAGVGFFYDYAAYNTGFGLCAKTNVNIFFSEPADILQVGYEKYFVHTVVAIDTIKKDDKVIDILINSNSLDRENYPLSAYNYTAKRLIKIFGYDEE